MCQAHLMSSGGNTTAVTEPTVSHDLRGLTQSKFMSHLSKGPMRKSSQQETCFHVTFQRFRLFSA